MCPLNQYTYTQKSNFDNEVNRGKKAYFVRFLPLKKLLLCNFDSSENSFLQVVPAEGTRKE